MRYSNGRYDNPGFNGQRPLHDAGRKRAFGLRPQDKWPRAGMPAIVINGITHRIRADSELSRGDSRRAIAQCPHCNKWFDAGHIGQHTTSHKVTV